jgi:hypothetical protein
MRTRVVECLLLTVMSACIGGCKEGPQDADRELIAEGVIYSVQYDIGEGKTGGLTRVNTPKAVPGGNGSWNVDAYGKLFEDCLVLTQPASRSLGPKVIPIRRLLYVQFGDGGIKEVADQASLE